MRSDLGTGRKVESRAAVGRSALENRERWFLSGGERRLASGEPVIDDRGFAGLGIRRRPRFGRSAESSPRPDATMRREWLFRRALLVADVVAIVLAFVLTVELSSRSLQLTWMSIVGVPILLVGAKMLGLYDRDETLLRKTTLDEAPKLFEVATLCTLVAWLAGGLIVEGRTGSSRGAVLVVDARGAVDAGACRCACVRAARWRRPSGVCSSAMSELAEAIRPKLTAHGGVKAEMVAHLDLDNVGSWSTDACSAHRLSEIRELARTLDIQRAIVAPGSADARRDARSDAHAQGDRRAG